MEAVFTVYVLITLLIYFFFLQLRIGKRSSLFHLHVLTHEDRLNRKVDGERLINLIGFHGTYKNKYGYSSFLHRRLVSINLIE